MEAGGSKTVAITFTPPKDASSSTIEANTNVSMLKQESDLYKFLWISS